VKRDALRQPGGVRRPSIQRLSANTNVAIEMYVPLIMAKLIFLLTTGLLAQTPAGSLDAILHWNDAALQHQEQGRFRDAHEAYKRAIEAAGGAAVTPATRLRLQLNLASLYLEEREYGSAEQLIRAAERHAREVPPDSPELAGLYNAAGTLRLIGGKLSPAQQMFEKALAILDRPGVGLGNELASVLLNTASVQIRQGRYAEARRNLERAAGLLQDAPGASKSQLIRVLATRSTLEYLAKDRAAAESAAARAVSLAEAHYGPDNLLVAELMQNYALILNRLSRGKEARSYRARERPLIDVTELSLANRPAVFTK
jgi:tetratricopeptide (TPR) repeat protein